MIFYVAAAWSDRARAGDLITKLEARGHTCVYNWTTQDEQLGKDIATMTLISIAEVGAVRDCDVFVLLLPGARGSHVELGVALATREQGGPGPLVYVIGSPEDRTGPYGVPCGFHHLADRQFASVEEFLGDWRVLAR